MITLHTLGDAVIKVGDREVRPTSPIMFAALLYLGVERGQRVPRAALQELLFPKAGERSGAHSLRQLLYKLRQLGAPIQADGDVVSLPSDAVSDDYSANGNGSGPHTRARFLDLYAPHVSDAFDEWLDRKRAQIGAGLRRNLAAQMAARREVSDWASVERIAHEILAGDAFNDEATYALAEATAVSGSKSAAVRMLERYENETGRSDLKLNASVLRRRISERLPESRRRPLDTPFVGREPEAEAMRQVVLHLRGGTAGAAVIVGEPGIGKSRLLEETCALATLEGVNVQVVRCQPHYVSRPMGVFIELVPALMSSRGALGVAPETLAHLTLLTSHRDDRAHRPADARDDATRSGTLLAAVRDLVDAVAGEAPLLVAVEDAHWADPTSLIELSALVAGARGRALLVVYTTRQLEPLRQVGVVTDATPVLRLKPLADAPMKALSGHLLPSVAKGAAGASAGDVAGWCAQTAAGNPFYLQVLCAHYEDTRQPFTVPHDMRSATTRRIELLPKGCRRVLELVALLGHHANPDAVKTLTGLPNVPFLDAIQRLEEEGYLRTEDGAARVAHDLLRECTLELLPPLTRCELQRQVAASLETRYEASHDAALLWDCAEHWAESGESSKALHFVLRCARHAADIGRATQAAEILGLGSKYASTLEDQVLALTEQSRVSKAAGHWRAALETTVKTAALRRAAGANSTDWESEFGAIEAQWALEFDAPGAVPRLVACAQAAQAKPAHRTEAALLLQRIAHEQGDAELARLAFEAVSAITNSRSTVYSDRLLPLIYHTSFGDLSEALKLADQLQADLEFFDIADRLRAARNLSIALGYFGKDREAFDLSRSYYEKALRLDLRQWQYDFVLNCCCAMVNLEDFEEARNWLDRGNALRTNGLIPELNYSHITSGLDIALHAADRQAAEAGLEALSRIPMGTSIRGKSAVRGYQVRVAQMNPSHTSTGREIAELCHVFDKVKHLSGGDCLAIALAGALHREGDDDRLARLLDDYVHASRRERSPLPSALRKFIGA